MNEAPIAASGRTLEIQTVATTPAALPDMPDGNQSAIVDQISAMPEPGSFPPTTEAAIATSQTITSEPEIAGVEAQAAQEQNPLEAMGYQFVPDTTSLPENGTPPTSEAFPEPATEMARATLEPAVPQQPENSLPQPETQQNTTQPSLEELEFSIDADSKNLFSLDQNPTSAASRFGTFLGQQVARVKERWQTMPDRSEVVTFAKSVREAVQEFSDAYRAHANVTQSISVKDGKLSFTAAQPTSVEAGYITPPPVIAPPVIAEPTAQAKQIENNPAQPTAELAAPDQLAENLSVDAEPLSQMELVAQGYERFMQNPELLTEVSQVVAFFDTHNIVPELRNEVLASKFGEETAAFIAELQADGSDLEMITDMLKIGFTPHEAALLLSRGTSSETYTANVGEAGASNQELNTPITVTQEQPQTTAATERRNTIPQAILERNQQRSAPEGRSDEVSTAAAEQQKRKELFEQVTLNKGMSSSDLPVAAQINTLRTEAQRLQLKLQASPPEELERHIRNSISTIDRGGKESTAWTTFEYDGEIETPEATSDALFDTSVKLEALGAVARAQSTEFANDTDKLAVAESLLKQRFGNEVTVSVNRGSNENGEPITNFEPGKHSLAVSYENGGITLKVQNLGNDAAASNNLESNFTRKKK